MKGIIDLIQQARQWRETRAELVEQLDMGEPVSLEDSDDDATLIAQALAEQNWGALDQLASDVRSLLERLDDLNADWAIEPGWRELRARVAKAVHAPDPAPRPWCA